MSSAAVGTHSGAGPLSLMSCVRESSPLQDFDSDNEKNVASKRRFWNPKKWFKRKNKVSEDVVTVEVTETGKDALRSRSTSELSDVEEGRRRSSSSMHPGLSVSHDSIFHSPNSGSDTELDAAQSSSSLSICQPHIDLRLQTELNERLRIRRGRGDTSEDDEGFPHSSCNSPTTSDGLLLDKTAIKDLPTKSHSTCSDGSLLSMDSYEMDEDSSDPQSRHSSKLSLHEKKSIPDSFLEFGPSSTTAPLNHSAAHHRVSVKPKRTHGAPRRKRGQQLASALPATPEVNEESSMRSISPESMKKEALTELYSTSTSRTLTETQIKCSSLPPGLTAPDSDTNSKLNRSKSNAGSKSQDPFTPLHEDVEKEEKLSLFERIFPRKSGRKKKEKVKEEKEISKHEIIVTKDQTMDKQDKSEDVTRHETFSSVTKTESSSYRSSKHEVSKPIPAPRSGAASRQRIQPLDIPASPEEVKKETIILPQPSPEKTFAGTSPLQGELENRFKQRQISSSTSPPATVQLSLVTPPLSPKSPKLLQNPILPTVISSKLEYNTYYTKASSNTTKFTETKTRNEELRSKMKLPGLSSLQQRVLSLNDDDTDNGFKSLTDFPNENKKLSKPLTKSHSFKSAKKQSYGIEENSYIKSTAEFLNTEKKEESRISFTKATSLDSIKNLDEHKIHLLDLRKNENSKYELKTERISDYSNLDLFNNSDITISGPSHTAVVNVTSSNTEDFTSKSKTFESGSDIVSIKEHQVSVTKIQLKQETTHVTQSTVTIPKSEIPEFINKQLNKVETRPTSNIILSMKSPKIVEDQNRPRTLFNFDTLPDVVSKPPTPRKFSKENLEIIEKDREENSPKTPILSVASVNLQPSRFKKNDLKGPIRKSSVISITPESPVRECNIFKNKSTSLESLRSDANESDQSSQDSLDKLDNVKDKITSEPVVLRKKSIVNKKNDEEPELMKVFARRSWKLKDSDVDILQKNISESKTRDSDKENQNDSPVDDRKKWFSKTESITETEKKKDIEGYSPVKEPLVENKPTELKSTIKDSDSPVMLRKTFNSNIFIGQRAISINTTTKTIGSEALIKKQSSFSERRKTDQWITNKKNEDAEVKEKMMKDEIISNISLKSELITEPKNFNQRKAEWEKRAQLAQMKKIP